MPRSPSKNSRQRAQKAGNRAEVWAEFYLRAQFYAIRGRRIKMAGGELDLVAMRGNTTLFVEVKMRHSASQFGQAMEAVNQRRIINAAHQYIGYHPELADTFIRFDVIFLAPFSWPRHVKDAFQTR